MVPKSQRTFLRLNILGLVCAMVCLVCYDIFGGLWLKGLTSAWFVALGGLNLICARIQLPKIPLFLILIELGLIFGMCADVLLGVRFIAGILFFAFGHVLYLAAFCALEKMRPGDLAFILPIGILSLWITTGTPFIQISAPVLEKLLMGYAVIISCMLGKAISNFRRDKTVSRTLMLLGSAMFWFSDIVLAIDMFGSASRLTWILCSYVYWPAQNILAFSLFHYISEQSGRSITDNQ